MKNGLMKIKKLLKDVKNKNDFLYLCKYYKIYI